MLASAPRLSSWARQGRVAGVGGVLPAVTCSVQATYLTGLRTSQHGVVGNGWYLREEGEVRFWHQSNRLVQGEKVWEKARAADPALTCANLFWWFNMNSSVDWSVTPRPMYLADGRKMPDVYTQPAELRSELQAELGQFPLFEFWGPRTSIRASRWIAEAARRVELKHNPTLNLVYLPHLDYAVQRVGPQDASIPSEVAEIDGVCADLIEFYESRGARVIVLSEYGISEVDTPIHLNRALRSAGLLVVREELGHELLDAGASAAFAVADHQVAHVYVNDQARLPAVRELVAGTAGVEMVLDEAGKREYGLDHPRAGDLVAVARPGAWFTYYYWLEDEHAPDFARTVEIHRKPGYDPAELFIDPRLRLPQLKAALFLLRKRLGFRALLEVIPLDASLVMGSHGRLPDAAEDGPLLVTRQAELLPGDSFEATAVCGVILRHLGVQPA